MRTASELIALNQSDHVFQSDTGAGQVLVDQFGYMIKYATDVDRWYYLEDTHWRPDTKNAVHLFALTQSVTRYWRDEAARMEDETARREEERRIVAFEGVNKRRAMLTVAQSDPRVQLEVEQFDAVPNELTAPNGIIDLDTSKLRDFTQADLTARCCAVPYDPDATSPLLDEFLNLFMPDPREQRFLWALLGYALRGGNPKRILAIFYGETTSGKSQLFAALNKVLGEYMSVIGSSIFRGNLDDKPRPDMVDAMFTRIAYATEASKNWALHADQVKRLTGGDRLPYRDLYQGMVKKDPRFTPMIITNVLPRIVGSDPATARRILAVGFNVSLPVDREDPGKRDAFLNDDRCLRAILARLVAGARDEEAWREIPERFMLATMSARSDLDHTDAFLAWMTEEGYLVTAPNGTPASHCITTTQLYKTYRYWLKTFADKTDRQDEVGMAQFGRALRDKGWEAGRSAGTRWLGRLLSPSLPLQLKLMIDATGEW